MTRPIVGFGHSMGGSIMLDLALMHPRLLTSVIVIEAIAASSQKGGSWPGVAAITKRKDSWPSKDAAMKYFRKAPIHKRWDPRVLDLLQAHSFTAPNGPSDPTVALKTSKYQEAISFARAAFPESRDSKAAMGVFDRKNHPEMVGVETDHNAPLHRPEATTIYRQIASLRPSCLLIYGTHSQFSANLPWRRKEKMDNIGIGTGGSGGAPEGRVGEIDIEGSHWMPFEKPDALGQALGEWLDAEMRRWQQEEAEHEKAWSAVPVEQRSQVSDEWLYWTDRLYGKEAMARLAGARKKGDKSSGKPKL